MSEFLQNAWYVAGWTHELDQNQTLARTIVDHPLVFYRAASEAVVCLLDRCPHRFAPLSMGRIEGDNLRCGYHGMRFGPDGVCRENPHGGMSRALRVRAFPVIERHRLLWVWTGEPDLADSAHIPELPFIDRAPEASFISGYVPTAANHLLMVDNILDLTHADYLHPESLGGGSMTRSTASIESMPHDSLRVAWIANDEAPLPIMRMNFPEPDARIDMWTEVQWWPSGVMTLITGGTPTRQPRSAGMNVQAVHIMTPATQSSTHYFYSNTRSFATDNVAVTENIAKALRFAFEQQDKPMIEGQQARIGSADLLSLHPALQRSDGPSTQARRILTRLVREEAGNPPQKRESASAETASP
jgi:phenylpropionate dioxygenase-like ring-hydroxylating dioxygenase large terminal subunit